ncbi:unnamed protein product [Brassica oleracea]|uniref:(rape) hypothetical protein n=1 Tax=Brassica napus TaxID=3708 RepID=A0A816UED5_BRANA|nr:unnamed protein product [Brassica napus]
MSSLMFSKEDNRFYIPSRGGNYLCYLVEKQEKLEVMDLKFDEFPASVYEEVAKLSSLSRTDHLVESPTGQLFLVKWAGVQSGYYEKTMIYTEDIGDLCIFLGHSQAFCVPVSSSPGLKPNCIYFVGRNFGVYDLTTKTCTAFSTQYDGPVRRSEFPYWPL